MVSESSVCYTGVPQCPRCVWRGRARTEEPWGLQPGRTQGGHYIHWCHTLIHLSGGASIAVHRDALLRGNTRAHKHKGDEKVTITYFSSFQQDLSLLLVLPLLLDSLQLFKEAQLRANVCRLLVALIILTRRQRDNQC